MTVCIAALHGGGKGVVLASDRMETGQLLAELGKAIAR